MKKVLLIFVVMAIFNIIPAAVCADDSDAFTQLESYISQGRIVMDKKDHAYIKSVPIDRRVLYLLVDLGKRHTLKVRIKSGYDAPYASDDEYNSSNGNFVSTHAKSKAVDIFVIDGVVLKNAHLKQRQIVTEILKIGFKDNFFAPNQIVFHDNEDCCYFFKVPEAVKLYGKEVHIWNKGIFHGLKRDDYVHIGY